MDYLFDYHSLTTLRNRLDSHYANKVILEPGVNFVEDDEEVSLWVESSAEGWPTQIVLYFGGNPLPTGINVDVSRFFMNTLIIEEFDYPQDVVSAMVAQLVDFVKISREGESLSIHIHMKTGDEATLIIDDLDVFSEMGAGAWSTIFELV